MAELTVKQAAILACGHVVGAPAAAWSMPPAACSAENDEIVLPS